MKHFLRLTAVLLCVLLGACALGEAQQPLLADETIFRFPQFDVLNAADESINRYYAEAEEKLKNGLSELAGCEEMTFQVTHFSERYASVLFTLVYSGGNGSREVIVSDTFARDGLYAGQRVTLSRLLGLEETSDGSESMAASLAYDLIWDLVALEAAKADGDYPEGIVQEDVVRALDPEKDFYLDADGNIVFFVQSGELAGEIAGILHFPFAPAELLSSAKL